MIHAERTQVQRNKIIERFKSGDLWCLICTDVLARGVDFKGVNLVINYDVPRTAQAYVHRIGRTGRAGRAGKAVTFYTKQDALAIKPIINVMKQSGCPVSDWMQKISTITRKEKEMLKRGKLAYRRKKADQYCSKGGQTKEETKKRNDRGIQKKKTNRRAPSSRRRQFGLISILHMNIVLLSLSSN